VHLPPASLRRNSGVVLLCLVVIGIGIAEHPGIASSRASSAQERKESSAHLRFVREFSSADDVGLERHPVFDRSLDIIAGPAESHAINGKLVAPYSVATDSGHRVFVADPEAGVVHVFDFEQSKYSVLNGRVARLRSPTGIAVDREDNVYVTDTAWGAVVVYDSKGRFLRYLGKGEEGETYFEAPVGIAIHTATDHIYVCDSRRHMILMLDKKGHVFGHFGKRWGGKQPGDFRYPSRIVIGGDEIFVLDSGNSRLQVLDLGGHFRREIKLPEVSANDGLALDNEKNIYVSDVQLNVINVLNRDGQFLYKFGRSGAKPGEFNQPSGMWIESENRLYIADTKNSRVQLFQIEEQP
jgi:DNA-binding beta-propeller fold protein YncE